MLAIADYLKSQGYAPSSAEHMRIPEIWKKLGSLYNLEALDERVGTLDLLFALVISC
jgi:MRG-binding protein